MRRPRMGRAPGVARRRTVESAGRGLTLDARLQENPTQWITAKGHLPTALFSSNAPDAATAQIDLTVDSSPINLGVVQGFTSAITDVPGSSEAHLRVAGTAADPEPSGVVTLDKGAVSVDAVGVRYTNIDGKIEVL